MTALILGEHPELLTVRLVKSDPAVLVVNLLDANGQPIPWPSPPVLEFGYTSDAETPLRSFVATVDDSDTSMATFSLTVDDVEGIAALRSGNRTVHNRLQLAGTITNAGTVDWNGGWTGEVGRTQRTTTTVSGNVISQLLSARDEAVQAAVDASAEADAAQAARAGAETAQTGAQAASVSADAARAGAETAAGEAQGSAALAGSYAGTAASEASAAETARSGAETARSQAQAAAIVGAASTGAPPAATADITLGATRVGVLAGNYTLPALPTPPADQAGAYTLVLKQPSAGGPFTVNLASVPEWVADAAAPTMPSVANSELWLQFVWNGLAWLGVGVGTRFP